ncbi:MAG: hypothetical protein RL456_3305, partial [Pseudomonadota bacterium]
AVGLGNALRSSPDAAAKDQIEASLGAALDGATPLVREHIAWALGQRDASP